MGLCVASIIVAFRQPVYEIISSKWVLVIACENFSKYYPIVMKFSGYRYFLLYGRSRSDLCSLIPIIGRSTAQQPERLLPESRTFTRGRPVHPGQFLRFGRSKDTSAIDFGPDQSIRVAGHGPKVGHNDCYRVLRQNLPRFYSYALFNNLVLAVPKMGRLSESGTLPECKWYSLRGFSSSLCT